ncbi:unnamed protein product [Penicillium olsonii]|nr:unnamed protein product [Penicillium olsonii]
MRLFKKNKSPTNHPVRSAEQLVPALAPHPDPVDDRRYSQFEYQAPSQSRSNTQSLSRSQSQRQSKSLRDRPTVNVVPDDRRDKGLPVRPSSGVERSVSIRGKTISNPVSQPASPRVSHPDTLNETDEFPPQHSYSENPSPVTAPQSFEPRSASLAYQHTRGPRPSHPAHTQENHERSQLKPVKPPLYTQPLRASDTTDQQYTRPSPTDIPESPYLEKNRSFTPQDPVMTTRLPSRTLEPLSPVQSRYPDAMQSQAQGQSPFQPDKQSAGSPQDSSRRGSVSNMPKNGRITPTPTHRREDSGDIDVRALIQKHDELQAKYSKVKRYYFEKDAQVQHLQNTVAHQRMAVSRTVLDDNEYTNRFQRLDGAIKDLAFSVRKDWRNIPSWLNGMVSDEAISTVTKEMTPVGRAIISRWLVEEVFQRHFHPALEPGFSTQLKSIEMNLRRQRPTSDEERENASARLSYWRRTTFDGLSDSLVGPEADGYRGDLVEHLIVELAAFMGSQLHERAHPGLEAGVRMIVENSINIIEKIPLEARDVCVDYFPPGVSFADQYMKIEGQLPALNHPPPLETEEEAEEPSTAIESPSPAQAKSRKSVFGALMGRKVAASDTRPTAGEKEVEAGPPRIRYAAFLAVEVRGKGPATVLIKSPVWLVE